MDPVSNSIYNWANSPADLIERNSFGESGREITLVNCRLHKNITSIRVGKNSVDLHVNPSTTPSEITRTILQFSVFRRRGLLQGENKYLSTNKILFPTRLEYFSFNSTIDSYSPKYRGNIKALVGSPHISDFVISLSFVYRFNILSIFCVECPVYLKSQVSIFRIMRYIGGVKARFGCQDFRKIIAP